MKQVKKAVLLAAGFGTRFLPFSKAVSKAMLPIIDTPTIELICNELADSGIEEILIIVGQNRQGIKQHFARSKVLEKRLANKPEYLNLITKQTRVKILFKLQKKINGTAGALALAEKFVAGEPFVLAFADDLMVSEKPVAKQLIEVFEKTGKMVLGCQNVSREAVTKYCSVCYDGEEDGIFNVTDVVEKPKLEDVRSTLSSLGRYVFTSSIFDYIKTLKMNPTCKEYCITDAFTPIAQNEGLKAIIFDATRYDIGNKFGYLTACVDFALADKEYSEKLKEHLKDKI